MFLVQPAPSRATNVSIPERDELCRRSGGVWTFKKWRDDSLPEMGVDLKWTPVSRCSR